MFHKQKSFSIHRYTKLALCLRFYGIIVALNDHPKLSTEELSFQKNNDINNKKNTYNKHI